MTGQETKLFASNVVNSQCANCHGGFECQIAAGCDHCWCMKFPAVLPVNANAACLCPNCLKLAIESHMANAAASTKPTDDRETTRGNAGCA